MLLDRLSDSIKKDLLHSSFFHFIQKNLSDKSEKKIFEQILILLSTKASLFYRPYNLSFALETLESESLGSDLTIRMFSYFQSKSQFVQFYGVEENTFL